MREDLLRGRGATVDSVGTEVVFLAVSHPGSRSRRGAPMCRGTSTRSPPIFHQAAGPIVLSPAEARVGQMGLRIYRARNAQYLILQRVEEELFSGRHRAATATRSAIRPAMPVVVAGPGVHA